MELKYFNLDKLKTIDQINARQKELAKKYHPDKHPDKTEEQRKKLSAKMAEINVEYRRVLDAYEILGNDFVEHRGEGNASGAERELHRTQIPISREYAGEIKTRVIGLTETAVKAGLDSIFRKFFKEE